MKTKLGTVLGIAAILALPAAAGEGRIPIGFPTMISAPGHYVVTRDLDGGGLGSAVIINADGVTLDLNGFTLSDAINDVLVITGTAGAQRGVTIRNGRISGGFAGIYADGGSGRRLVIENLIIEGSGERGILIEHADELTVRGCTIRGTADSGLEAIGAGGGFAGHILDNEIGATQFHGIHLFGLTAGIVEGNRLDGTGLNGGAYNGIRLDATAAWNTGGNLVARNTIVSHGGSASALEVTANLESCLIRENVIQGSTVANGLLVDSPTSLVIGNVATGNAGSGLLIGGQNSLVELNHLGGNSNHGLACGGLQSHAYRNNMLRGSTPFPVNTMSCEFSSDAGGNIR